MSELTAQALEAGRTYGSFRLIRVLGQGGGGQVWEADDVASGRRVALKVLTEVGADSDEAWARFEREGRLAASLSHPACVFVFGTAEVEGRPAISMELMRGGTLRDRVKREGAFPVQEAVASILDVVEGLEAAQRAGILHRDVKPSNCFLDEDGVRTKVGDFGVSKTLEVPSDLSLTGAFIGTPHYASPEQVRGDELDHRSDIYSVGATLYELLTGKVPFEGAALSVAARILGDPPAAPSSANPEVPKALDRVVLRLLAKDPAKRFQSYEEVRGALAPFRPGALSAGELGKRLLAWVVDSALLMPISMSLAFSSVGASSLVDERAWVRISAQLVVAGMSFLYYFVLEARWQASLGKRLLGLRVVDARDAAPAPRAIAARSALFIAVPLLVPVLVTATLEPSELEEISIWVAIASWAGLVVLLSTARRSNGFAGVHELLSGTRVVSPRVASRVRTEDRPLTAAASANAPDRVGPYRVEGIVWEDGGRALVLGRDEALARAVWIHRYQSPTDGPPLERLVQASGTRLQWLQGAREPGRCWDAYGVPSGTALEPWVEAEGGVGWEVTRRVMRGLVEELTTRPGEPVEASLKHVWVDGSGGVKLLDFPAGPPSPREVRAGRGDRTGLDFVARVARFCLRGWHDPNEAAGLQVPLAPMPGHARALLGDLASGDIETLEELRARLSAVADAPASVTRGRRAISIGLGAILPIAMTVTMVAFSVLITLVPDLSDSVAMIQSIEILMAPDRDGHPPDEVEAARVLLAHVATADSRSAMAMWAEGPLKEIDPERSMEDVWALADSILRERGPPTAEQLAAARDELMDLPVLQMVITMPVLFGSVVGLAAVLLALVLRGGPVLKSFGIEIRRLDGSPAGRVRCAARAAVAWSPLFLGFLLSNFIDGRGPLETAASTLCVLVALVGAALAIRDPERAPQDKIVGTYVVPR